MRIKQYDYTKFTPSHFCGALNILLLYGKWILIDADKGFAPLNAGHEPVMLLLHQSAF